MHRLHSSQGDAEFSWGRLLGKASLYQRARYFPGWFNIQARSIADGGKTEDERAIVDRVTREIVEQAQDLIDAVLLPVSNLDLASERRDHEVGHT